MESNGMGFLLPTPFTSTSSIHALRISKFWLREDIFIAIRLKTVEIPLMLDGLSDSVFTRTQLQQLESSPVLPLYHTQQPHPPSHPTPIQQITSNYHSI